MKVYIGLLSLVLSITSFASTVDKKSFVYDGTQNSVELVLRTEKTHTEYRTENLPATCYRTEVVGYRTICTGGGYRPYPGNYGPYPRPYPGPNHCFQEPIYRSVAYSCIKPVTTSYEVRDYDVEARVVVDVTKVSPEATPGEKIEVTLRGEDLQFTAVGSKKFFIVKKKESVRSSMMGSVKMINGLLAVELVEAQPVVNVLKISGLKVVDGKLQISMPASAQGFSLGQSLKVVKQIVLASDPVLFDRELSASEVEVVTTAEATSAGVGLEKIGVVLKDGKFELTAKVFPKLGGVLLNSSEFSTLSASKTLVYKAK